jgi:hypothetical protein
MEVVYAERVNFGQGDDQMLLRDAKEIPKGPR